MGGEADGMSNPTICHPTHPYYIRKPLALRGLNELWVVSRLGDRLLFIKRGCLLYHFCVKQFQNIYIHT
jgi:hypothetical protein